MSAAEDRWVLLAAWCASSRHASPHERGSKRVWVPWIPKPALQGEAKASTSPEAAAGWRQDNTYNLAHGMAVLPNLFPAFFF